MIKTTLAVSLIAALTACGGGSSSGTPATTTPAATSAEGLWKGTTSNGRAVTGLVLDDGVFWVLYSTQSNNNLIAGAVQGSGTSNNGSFASSNAIDFNLEGNGILATTLSASYTQKQSFNGTFTYPTLSHQTVTFTSAYSADYEITPTLATIVGTYTGYSAVKDGIDTGTVAISASGAISAVGVSGCASTGTVTPRAKGNVYNVSLTYGAAPCATPRGTVTGIGYFDAAAKRIYALAMNGARSNGIIFVGAKSS